MDLRIEKGLTEAEFLAQYDPNKYEKPSVTSDILVFGMSEKLDALKVLLIKRKDHPYIGQWALPGGFINMSESAYEAACRELEEETGLTNVYLEQLYTMSQPKRDPRMRVLSIVCMALIPETVVKAGDDASEAVWFTINFKPDKLELFNLEYNVHISYNLETKEFINGVVKTMGYVPILDTISKRAIIPRNDDCVIGEPVYLDNSLLAFDHAEIVLEGLLRLRNKVDYTDVAFNFVSKKFTLPDLQRVYETILGTTLYTANFRSDISGKIEPIKGEKATSLVGGRKSQLYKYVG